MQKETGELILSEIIKINDELKGVNKRLDGIDARLDKMDKRIDMLDRKIDEVHLELHNEIHVQVGGLRQEMKSNFSDIADHITFVASEIWNKTERRKVYA